MRHLAERFGVSERTVRNDIKRRLTEN
ncbi:MAG: HTH domain-containing protein [Anaerobutyricum hallii]